MKRFGLEISVLVLAVTGAVVVISILSGTATADTTTVNGEWHFTENTTLSDGSWVINGTIIVSNCTLTLDKAQLNFNSKSSEYNRILVMETGRLVSRDSWISGVDLGVCLEVLGDTLLENTTITNMDREYRGFGIYHVSGNLSAYNCTFEYGLVLVRSQSNLTIRDCSFSNFEQIAIDWRFLGVATRKTVVIEGSMFQNRRRDGFERAISIEGAYFDPLVTATLLNNTFLDVYFCIEGYGFLSLGSSTYGTLLIEGNRAVGCIRGLAVEGGSVITVRGNDWDMRYLSAVSGTVNAITIKGDGSPSLSNETIRGGRTGLAIIPGGPGGGSIEIINVTITEVDVGISVNLVRIIIRDSRIDARVQDFIVTTTARVHLHNCWHNHRSWVFGTGEILDLTEINITSVTWQEGTPIKEGTVVFETDEGFQITERDNTAPEPILFPTWVLRETMDLRIDSARGAHRQGEVVFYSELFPLEGVDHMTLIIHDRFTPFLAVENPTDGAKIRVDSLLAMGSLIERGAGMGTVRVRCTGGEWEEARLYPDGKWRLTMADLTDGIVSVNVNATDRAGNSVQFEVGNITVDTVVPPIEVLGPPSQVRTTPAELVVRTEPGSTAHVNYRSVEVSEEGMFSTLITIFEGENGVLITVEDFVGNRNQTVFIVYLDTVAPLLQVTSPMEGEWTRGELVWVNGTTQSGSMVSVNGELVDASTGSFSFTVALEEGESNFFITSVDPAGNVASVTRTVHVDRTPPVLEILGPVDGHLTNERILIVVGNARDASPVAVLVQGDPAVMVDTKWFKELLFSEGSNDVEVVAVDAAGNMATMHLKVVLDTVPPVVGVTVGGATLSTGSGAIVTGEDEASFLFSADEDVTVEVAGGTPFPMEAGSLARRYLLEEGANRFTFVMRDEAGNEAGPFTFTIERDTEPPELFVTYPVDGTLMREGQVLVRGFTEAGATLSIGGTVPVSYINGNFEALVPLSMGPNSILLEATDAANNTASRSVEVIGGEQGNAEPIEDGSPLPTGILGAVMGVILSIVFFISKKVLSNK